MVCKENIKSPLLGGVGHSSAEWCFIARSAGPALQDSALHLRPPIAAEGHNATERDRKVASNSLPSEQQVDRANRRVSAGFHGSFAGVSRLLILESLAAAHDEKQRRNVVLPPQEGSITARIESARPLPRPTMPISRIGGGQEKTRQTIRQFAVAGLASRRARCPELNGASSRPSCPRHGRNRNRFCFTAVSFIITP